MRTLGLVGLMCLLVFSAPCSFGNGGRNPHNETGAVVAGSDEDVLSATLGEILEDPESFLNKEVRFRAKYGDPEGRARGVPATRSDYAVYDGKLAIYVSGMLPEGIERYSHDQWGTPLVLQGRVRRTDGRTIFIQTTKVTIDTSAESPDSK